MIFVAGISCAGKTHTVARFVAERSGSFRHVSASNLLKTAQRPLWPLPPQEVEPNQRVLLDTLGGNAGLKDPRTVLLDGHAFLETTEGPRPVPDWFFESLPFDGFVCIVEDPSAIAERRRERGWATSVEEADMLQELERRLVSSQADRLERPSGEARAGDLREFSQLIEGMTARVASRGLSKGVH